MSKRDKSNFATVAEKALQEAVKQALETHAKMGVPAVFIKNGKLCYRMPNGKIVHNLKKGI